MKLVYDTEGNGLLPVIDRFWCLCTKDVDTLEERQFRPDEFEEGIDFLFSSDEIICHNQIGFDLPAMEKVYGRTYKGIVTDSLVLSRLLNPDRSWGHSLAGWAKHLGNEQKVENEDWSKYTEHMLHRCVVDVRINYDAYMEMLQEMEN